MQKRNVAHQKLENLVGNDKAIAHPTLAENSKILLILIQTLYRQVAHSMGFKSIDRNSGGSGTNQNPPQRFTIARDKSEN